jgi:antitoxin HicB
MFDYPVTLTPDAGTVLVTFADVPEAITFGTDEGERYSMPLTRWKPPSRSMLMRGSRYPCPANPSAGKKPCAPVPLRVPSWGSIKQWWNKASASRNWPAASAGICRK